MLLCDFYYLCVCVKIKGDCSVGLFSVVMGLVLDIKLLLCVYCGEIGLVGKVCGFEYGVEVLFDYVIKCVYVGLLVLVVCLSYGGDLVDVLKFLGYEVLCDVCEECKVDLMFVLMSIIGMVNVGEGVFIVGFVVEEYVVEF